MLANAPLDPQWTSPNFNDENWEQGLAGFGYGDNDDYTLIPQGSQSIFLRIPFYINQLDVIQQLILDLDYDDGFVAYINQQEVARANIAGNPPAYDSDTLTDHEANIYQGGPPDRFILDDSREFLQEGQNILCIQVHNTNRSLSDLTAIPFLSAVFNTPAQEGISPPGILNLQDRRLHTNFKISSQSETLYLYNASRILVDSIYIENLPSNISLGISEDSNTQEYYLIPTPGVYFFEFKDDKGYLNTSKWLKIKQN